MEDIVLTAGVVLLVFFSIVLSIKTLLAFRR
jgi:hypothetical protein